MHLEIACFNLESAMRANAASADRIELCADQSVGGITPPLVLFTTLKSNINMPINVMIRPRGNPDFLCTTTDLAQMAADIAAFARAGASGFVFGGLTSDGRVDVDHMRELVCLARGRPCTFHRAFDAVAGRQAEEELERVIECGFSALLTSGGAPSAVQGQEALRRLVERARGRIEVIVGGGVRSANVEGLVKDTGASWFHSSGIVDGSEEASPEELRALRRVLDVPESH
jgi:copper homeostasis protein